jgi:peptidoglycan-associated lipoprotein
MNSCNKIALFTLFCLGLAGCGGHNIRSASSRLPPPPMMPSSTDSDGSAGSLRSRAGRDNSVDIPPPPVREREPEPIPVSTPVDSNANARRAAQLRDVFFDYNRSAVNAASVPVLAENLEALQQLLQTPSGNITIEGHADDRGSEEFNLALADHRATAVKEFLVQRGLSSQRLNTVSYGKEKPQCNEQTEACWSRNRRAHFTNAY